MPLPKPPLSSDAQVDFDTIRKDLLIVRRISKSVDEMDVSTEETSSYLPTRIKIGSIDHLNRLNRTKKKRTSDKKMTDQTLVDAKLKAERAITDGKYEAMMLDNNHRFTNLEAAITTSQNTILAELKHVPSIWQILGVVVTVATLAFAIQVYFDTSFTNGQNTQKSVSSFDQKIDENKKAIEEVIKILKSKN